MSYSQALDGLISTLRYINSAQGIDDLKAMAGKEGAVSARQMFRRMIDEATPYFWSRPILSIIDGSRLEMPTWRLTSEILPTRAGYFWFDRPFSVPCPTGHDDQDQLRAILWGRGRLSDGMDANGLRPPAKYESWEQSFEAVDGGDGNWETVWILPIMSVATHPGPQMTVPPMPWPIGHHTPGALDDDWVKWLDPDRGLATRPFRDQVFRAFAACLAFIEQRILVQSIQRPDRMARKRAAPVFDEERPIRVIELRKRATPSAPQDEHDPIEWACRWVVSGHWRQQWFPSLQENRPIWITPYIKGPEDKPLKAPAERVFAVVR